MQKVNKKNLVASTTKEDAKNNVLIKYAKANSTHVDSAMMR